MGCSTSGVSIGEIECETPTRSPKRKSSRMHFKTESQRQSVSSKMLWRDPENLESYRSYTSTPMIAPPGMLTLPDREMHDNHLFALKNLRDLIEKHPIKFANEIENARRRRFPSISQAPEQVWDKVSYSHLPAAASAYRKENERIGRKTSLRAITTSTCPSERSQERHRDLRSRANICSTASNCKAHSAKSASPDASFSSTITPASSGILDSASADSSFSEADRGMFSCN